MTDGIDKSQWLPQYFNPFSKRMERVPPVNAFRQQHGIVQWEGQAIKALTWLPDILNHNKNLDDDELHICKRVERAALSAMAALGLSNLRVFIAGDMNTGSLPEHDPFKEILQGMQPKYSTALLWVICDERNGGNVQLAIKILSTIRTAIGHAKNILEKLDNSGNIGSVASLPLRPEFDPTA